MLHHDINKTIIYDRVATISTLTSARSPKSGEKDEVDPQALKDAAELDPALSKGKKAKKDQ
jgi:hypothetical protein